MFFVLFIDSRRFGSFIADLFFVLVIDLVLHLVVYVSMHAFVVWSFYYLVIFETRKKTHLRLGSTLGIKSCLSVVNFLPNKCSL